MHLAEKLLERRRRSPKAPRPYGEAHLWTEASLLPRSHNPAMLSRCASPRSQIWASQSYRICPDGPLGFLSLKAAVERETAVQAIDVHREFKNCVVTFWVMSQFLHFLGASRGCADFRDPTAVFRLRGLPLPNGRRGKAIY